MTNVLLWEKSGVIPDVIDSKLDKMSEMIYYNETVENQTMCIRNVRIKEKVYGQ